MGDEAVRPAAPATGGSTDTAQAGPESGTPGDDAPRAVPVAEGIDAPDAADRPHPDGSWAEAPVSAGTQVIQDAPASTPAQLRVDFGAHLEANYRRLVAQLYAITLDPAEAHSAVQDAYSRAWRSWAMVSRSPDSVGWVRRVAVRSTVRSWRRLRPRARRPVGPGPETQTGAVLAALRALPATERRCIVLHHMAGAPVQEIAAVEGVPVGTTAARLARAQQVVSNGLAGVVDFDVGFGADFGAAFDADFSVDLDAAWDVHPNGNSFRTDEPSDGFDGWPPDWDETRPADDKEEQR